MKLDRSSAALVLVLALNVVAATAAVAQATPIAVSPFATLTPPEAPPPSTVRPSARVSMDAIPTAPEVMPLPALPPRPDLIAARDRLKRPSDLPALATVLQIQRSSVAAPDTPVPNVIVPPGATGRCKDGSYFTGTATESRCTDARGLAYLLPR